MELHRLRYFVAVARLGSFTQAAGQQRVAQPSLSQQIRQLEEELGAPLFDRSARRIRLTPAGEFFLPRAERVLAETAQALQEMREYVGLEQAQVIIGTTPLTGSYILPRILAEVHRRQPGVKVIVREDASSAHLMEITRRGELDLSIASPTPGYSDLQSLQLLEEDLLLAVPPDHRLVGAGKVGLAEVADEPFLMVHAAAGMRAVVLTACATAGFQPQTVFESSHLETIQAMVAVGMGVSLVPRMAAQRERMMAPVYLELEEPRPVRTVVLVWAPDRCTKPGVKAFLTMVREVWR